MIVSRRLTSSGSPGTGRGFTNLRGWAILDTSAECDCDCDLVNFFRKADGTKPYFRNLVIWFCLKSVQFLGKDGMKYN